MVYAKLKRHVQPGIFVCCSRLASAQIMNPESRSADQFDNPIQSIRGVVRILRSEPRKEP
ncbi:hypothetical protein SJ05684_a39960 (plasmid) [Sinorhizobium sojae CCBAU 05684]|uniref:Uncharacterized protein n=1 Tax=Sinorhizobium sojae CCBAU 05684 TaxID=716928 RepID=A0A249PPV1_9HYPH|nr:hypothetical protein SJ05684_a39960 [Sinorhizobium sojae CCBAU 05684]